MESNEYRHWHIKFPKRKEKKKDKKRVPFLFILNKQKDGGLKA